MNKIIRENTKVISVGNVKIGGNNPIAIQSMTNTKTSDIAATLNQIQKLKQAGCDIVRVAVLNKEDADALKEITAKAGVPIVADIHFDYQLAIIAAENGVSKIRINPGNIGSRDRTEAVVKKCQEKNIPIRIGINSGSLEKELYKKYGGVTPEALLESISKHVELLESLNFYNIVLSIKATDIKTTIETNRLLASSFNYPIHIGLTESGTVTSGTIRSSYTLGKLLDEGIGSTIRVSLTGDPINEIPAAKEILSMLNLYEKPTLISCPTCGRTAYNMEPIVNEMESWLQQFNVDIKIAIMGCAVNGPGEAKDADIGIAGGNKEALLFKKGEIIRKIPEERIIDELKNEVLIIIKNRG